MEIISKETLDFIFISKKPIKNFMGIKKLWSFYQLITDKELLNKLNEMIEQLYLSFEND